MSNIGKRLATTVIFLFARDMKWPIGTGFIVGFPSPAHKDYYFPLVVTAKHILGDRQSISVRFSTRSSGSAAHVVYDLVRLRERGLFWEHGDEGVDIAIFPGSDVTDFDYKFVPIDLIPSKDIYQEDDIKATDRVVIPSLLWNFMGVSRNYPVIRDGTIALIPDEKVPMRYEVGSHTIKTEQEVLLINATAIQGASGSPIFLWPGPRLKNGAFAIGGAKPHVLGLLHGFYPAMPREVIFEDDKDDSEKKSFFAENSGIAIVFPAWRILEILDSPELKSAIPKIESPPEES